MTVTLRDQIDSTLTTLFTLTHGPQSRGRAERIRTVERDLRHLFELARVQEKKKPLLQRIKEWGYIFWG